MILKNQKNILILWFSVFILTIFLNLKINSILLILTILIPILINDVNNLIEVIIVILIGTPMLNGKIAAVFTRDGINILDILILVLFLKVIYVKFFRGEKLDFKLNLLDYLLGIFFILNFIAFIRGINFYGNFSIEFKNIIFMYLLYMTLKIYNFKVGIKRICDLIFYSVGIYSFCIFLIVIFGFTDKYALIDYEGRIAINITLLIITIPYYIYKTLNFKEALINKVLDIFIIFVELYLLYLNQNRTIIILTIISIILIFIISFFDGNRNLYLKIIINIVFIITTLIIILIVFNYMFKYIQPILDRFLDLVNKTGSYGNYLIRVNTINYYIPKVVCNFWGVGWGAPMMMFPEDGSIVYLNGAIDNYFITLGYKAGMITLIIYILILLISYYYIINLSIKRNQIYKIFIVLFPAIIIAVNYFTSQVFHTITTSTTVWILLYHFSRYREILSKGSDES